MAVPQGVDPRMLAYLAQRQLQHGQQQQQQTNYQHHQQNQQHHQQHQHLQQQQQQQQQYQQQQNQQQQQQQVPQQQGQRPGGDASAVASCLLQLKTNQYGEPVSEAEALQMQEQQQQQQQHQAALRQLPQIQIQMPGQQQVGVIPGSGGYPHSVVPHHGVHPIPGMSGIYHGYPGMVPFPQAPNGNFAVAAAAAAAMQQVGQGGYVPHQVHHQGLQQQHVQQQQQQQHHPQGSVNVNVNVNAVGLAPMPGGIPGMNHTPQQLGGAGVPPGSGGSSDGPIMTDAYIESLIADDDTASNKNKNNDVAKIETNGSALTKTNETTPAQPTDGSIISAKDDMNISLVVAKDRDLIPDALFVALGQMKPCLLLQSDRVGCYKTRTLEFLGMSCKHCGGQPGFGRYFPNSVRSLAQTTTSQTILKHIGGKCRACPTNVRKAVLELQRQQAHKEHLTNGRPRYGSRKIFFQRMWARLHGTSEDGETAVVVEADVTPEKAKQEAAAAATKTVASATVSVSSSSSTTISLVVPTKTSSMATTVPPTKDPSLSSRDVTSGVKRSLPSEVSNNNTDDEDAGNPSTTPTIRIESNGDTTSVLNINLSLNKKRKMSDVTMNTSTISSNGEDNNKVSCSEDDEDERKKLRISPVAV